jgi:hypothetical protein
LVSLWFLFSTLEPNLLELTSKSSNNPFKSGKDKDKDSGNFAQKDSNAQMANKAQAAQDKQKAPYKGAFRKIISQQRQFPCF